MVDRSIAPWSGRFVKNVERKVRLVTKNLLSQAPSCYGRHAKPLAAVAFAVAANGPVIPFSLCVIHKESLCPSSEGINRLMMMVIDQCNGPRLNTYLRHCTKDTSFQAYLRSCTKKGWQCLSI
jgi:hypothetical protein